MLKSPGTTCWPVTKPSHFFKHSLQWGVAGHWVGRPKTRWGVSSVQQAVQLQRQGWAPHLSLAHQACSGGKPLAGCLRMTTEATGASRCSPMVLMAKGELRSPISYWGGTRERLYLGNGTDSPKYRAGLWLAPVKGSLNVQSQEMVSSPCWSSARGHDSQSFMLFDPPARYLSSAFSFSGFSPRLVEI